MGQPGTSDQQISDNDEKQKLNEWSLTCMPLKQRLNEWRLKCRPLSKERKKPAVAVDLKIVLAARG